MTPEEYQGHILDLLNAGLAVMCTAAALIAIASAAVIVKTVWNRR